MPTNPNMAAVATAITALNEELRKSRMSSIGSGWRSSTRTKRTADTAKTTYMTTIGVSA